VGVRSTVVTRQPTKEIAVDKDQIRGAADQAKGAVKESVGKTIGDKQMQAEGTVDKLKGKLESAAGDAKETLRDVVNKATK